ncbi:unnamed protein product [Orchesella dallaii]|uniref:Uncharacterized protein n=1 Tax=Orchesella dallaii TaxID=48710 RepID=A0ABP1Q6H1_9HEXA
MDSHIFQKISSSSFSFKMHKIPNLNGSIMVIGGNIGILNQNLLDTVASARIFDMHGFSGYTQERNNTLLAIGKIVTELAHLCNFTPIIRQLSEPSSVQSLYNDKGTSGMIMPFVVPAVVSRQFVPMIKTRASLVLSVYQYFNFVYCEQSKDVLGIDLRKLAQPFRLNTWLALIFSFVLMTAAGSLVITKNVTSMALISVAALFSQTQANYNRHPLLPLWLLCCLILNHMYSGDVTSELVAPVEQDVIKSVDDLVTRKYHLVYTPRFKYMIKMAEKMASVGKTNGSSNSSSLHILLNSIIFLPTTPDFLKALAFQPRSAFFAPYMATMSFWHTVSNMNKKAYRRTRKVKFKRYCNLGRELSTAHSIPEVWIFKMKDPNMSTLLAHTFHRIDSAGIHDFWMKVFFRLQVASRAQDVYIFKSKTEVVTEETIEPLSLFKGNVLVIFIMFFICIVICVTIFLVEMLIYFFVTKNRSMDVVIYLE